MKKARTSAAILGGKLELSMRARPHREGKRKTASESCHDSKRSIAAGLPSASLPHLRLRERDLVALVEALRLRVRLRLRLRLRLPLALPDAAGGA